MSNSFRTLLNDIKSLQEEVTSSDIATVTQPVKNKKGKKCKMHKRINCQDCLKEKE